MRPNIASIKDLLLSDLNCMLKTEDILDKSIQRWNHLDLYAPLRVLLFDYQVVVKHHIDELLQISNNENLMSFTAKNLVINALIEDADEKLEACLFQEMEYACLISSLQAAIHYKISHYGSAAAFAVTLGFKAIAEMLHQFVAYEKDFNHRFSHLALHDINHKAVKPLLY